MKASSKTRNLSIMFACISAFNVYLAYLCVLGLENYIRLIKGQQKDIIWSFAPYHVSHRYINDRRILLLFLLLELMVLFYIGYLLLRPHAKLMEVKEHRVTDKISIPVPVGNGQHGNAWFADQEDIGRLSKTVSIRRDDRKKELATESGVVIGLEKRGDEDVIRYRKGFTHSLNVALTGSGKTRRFLLPSICLQLLAGDCPINSDIKGEIFYYTRDFARSLGYRDIVLDLNNPAKSNHYNFLQPVLDALEEGHKKSQRKSSVEEEDSTLEDYLRNSMGSRKKENTDYTWTGKAQEYAWDIVSTMVGKPQGEPLWFNGEAATICSTILAVCMEAPKECRNLANVYAFLAYMTIPYCGLRPLNLYLEKLPETHPARMIFMQSQIAADKTRASFYTSALGTLKLFTNPALADMSSKSDFKLSEIGENEKIILYLIVPDEKDTYYSIASIFINQLYIAQVETARRYGGKLPRNTVYNLDELGNFPYIPSMASLVSAGRSRGIRANLILQDYQQLEKIYEEDFKTIKAQCGLKVLLQTDSPDTLKEISETLGDYTVETVSSSSSINTGSKDLDTNISNSSNLTGRKLLKEEELSKLSPPYALYKITGESPIITELPDISKYHFNEFLGLGDEEHNRRKIQEVEESREERELKQVPLWGIWNEIKQEIDVMVAMQQAAKEAKNKNKGE